MEKCVKMNTEENVQSTEDKLKQIPAAKKCGGDLF